MMRVALRIGLAIIAIAAFAGPSVADDALVQPAPAHVALVIGNAAYTLGPTLPACAASANLVANRLKAAGFDAAEHLDATNGGLEAALTAFNQAVAIHPGTAAVVYFCGYAVNYQDRDFVLPVSAALNRPSDVLTEGVLERALGAVGANAGPALVLLDLFGLPNDGATAPTGALAQGRTNGRLAIAAALEVSGSDAATPAATALGTVLSQKEVKLPGLITHLRSLMPSGGPSFIGQEEAAADGWLIGEPHGLPAWAQAPGRAAAVPLPPAPEPRPAAPAAAAQSTPGIRAVPAPAAGSTPPAPLEQAETKATPLTSPAATLQVPPVPSRPPLPDEAKMTYGDRRDVQIALGRLGYYDGRIDALFGPDTRAAIRRWQHEVGAEKTGTLSGAQATRLVDQQVPVTMGGGNTPARGNRHVRQTQIVIPPAQQTQIVIPPKRPRPWWHFW